MAMTVTRDQFEVRENEVVHLPTGAIFGAAPNDKGLKYINSGLVGGLPMPTRDFDLAEIERVAKQLLEERLQLRD